MGKLRWMAVGLLAVVVGCVALVALTRPRIDSWALKQVGNGMSEREVRFIVGCSPGDYSGGRPLEGHAAITLRSMRSYGASEVAVYGPGGVVREWSGEEGTLLVGYDPTGAVCFTHLVERDGVDTSETPPPRALVIWVAQHLGIFTPPPPILFRGCG